MLEGLPLESWLMMAVLLGAGLGILWIGLWVWPKALRKSLAKRVEQRTSQLEDVSRRYRLMVDNGYDLTAVMSPDGKLDYVNSAYMRILGYPREGLRGKDIVDLMHPRDYELLRQGLDEAMGGISGKTMQLRFRHASGGDKGNWVYTEAILSGLPDKDWVVRQVVLHARDITSRKLVADDLARSEQRFRDFAGSSADWLWEVNEQLQFTYVSPGVTAVLGHEPEDLIGTMQLSALFEDPEDKTRELIESAVERRQGYRDLEFWSKSKQGDRVCLRLSAVPVFNEYHVFLGYRGAVSNITASKLDSEHMFRLATTDHLTGLLNRNRFKQELERAVALARRHSTQGIVMFVDLDRFKEINDTHGHEAGDKILVGVSRILRESVRSTDVVARLGGDEFAVIMHNIELEAAQEKVQLIVEGIANFSVEYQGARLGVTMSAGMVHYPQEDKGADHLLMSADLAMYRAKDMGRNRLFTDLEDSGSGTKNSVREQLKGVDRLRHSLDTGEFQLYLQPLVSLHKATRPLFECLLRIFDEDGKMLSPALYIDAAEHFGLIQRLDLAVVRRAFEMQKELLKAKVDADFTVNLSCRTLGDKDVMVKVKELVKELKIDPTRLVFEVTETMALHDPAEMRDIADIEVFIRELQALGFRFALDDFGSGFTSFKYLKLLPVDMVKIDGEYIKDLATSYEDRLFVENMVSLCRGLGIATVAEFVEDAEINEIVISMGIDYGQGWHYGKPLPGPIEQAKAFAGKTMGDYLPPERAAELMEKLADLASTVVSQGGIKIDRNGSRRIVHEPAAAPKNVAPKKMVAAGKAVAKAPRAKNQPLK